MNEQIVRVQEQRLDLHKLCDMAWRKRHFVAFTTLLSTLLTIAGTLFFVTPQYQSSVTFYVNNNIRQSKSRILRITNGDLSASRNLVDSYMVILHSRETMEAILSFVGSERNWEECGGMFRAEAVMETELFRVTVTGPDYREAKDLADAAAHILPRRINGIIAGASATVVEAAVEVPQPVSPGWGNNAVLGMIIGLALSLMAILLGSFRNVHFCHLVPGGKPWYS